MIKNLRVNFYRNTSNYQSRWGFGLWTEGGSFGTTYGEPGQNMDRVFAIHFLKWEFNLVFLWKKL